MKINQFTEGIELGDHMTDEPGWFIAREDGKIASGPYGSEREARRDTTRLQWFNPSQYFIDYGIQDSNGMFVDAETGQLGEDSDQVPKPGDNIRTKKTEITGVVESVHNNEVIFRLNDGRRMRSPLSNVIVVEKLADEDNEVVNEVSNELLARYKTAAGKHATAADKKGDYETGNKRFSGIVKATKKQFANDAKPKTEGFQVVRGIDKDRYQERPGLEGPFHAKNGKTVYYDPKEGKYYDPDSDFYISHEEWAAMNEGGMGGLNRCAPAQDVSYQHVLDRNPETAHSKVIGENMKENDILDEVYDKWAESQLNELSVGKMRDYTAAAKDPSNFRTRPLRKLVKTAKGVSQAKQKIDTKTGDRTAPSRRQGPPERGTYEERLAEFVALDEVDMNQFSDILNKQHQEVQAAAPKGKISSIPYHGWEIRYRKAVKPGEKINWKIFDKTGAEKKAGVSMSEKDAVADAEEWINSGGGTNKQASKSVTLDFNVDFARQFVPDGETFYVMFTNSEGKPAMYFSTEPQKGFKKSSIRTQKDKATGTTTLLPAVGLSASESNKIGFQPNGRYILGDKKQEDKNTVIFPLIYQSTSQSKTDAVRLGKPGLTVATSRDVDEDITPWGGYTADDPKAKALSKAPKTSMQGSGNVRFSDMVKDTIDKHGVKWAFDFYVKKHGLPPRQFQIFAGLTAKPPAKPKQPPVQAPVAKEPEKKSWWQKLRGKLPFEE